MTHASVSVALCTYNGERFLAEQLASIAQQTRLPDELVVCDDASTDGTVALVEEFARRASFPIRLHVNQQNVRSTKNFEAAIRLCQGDYIVLADQDDVWEPQKIVRLAHFLDSNPAMAFVFTDAVMVDSHRRPLGYTLWQAIEFLPRIRRSLPHSDLYFYLLKRYCVTGATMAFRGNFKSSLLPIPASWVHDAWIALILSAIAQGGFIDEPLIEYRQHSSQQIGERPRSLYQQYLIAKTLSLASYKKVVQDFTFAQERLQSLPATPQKKKAALAEKLSHFAARCQLRNQGKSRWLAVCKEAGTGRYSKYSLGWKSVCQDLFLQ